MPNSALRDCRRPYAETQRSCSIRVIGNESVHLPLQELLHIAGFINCPGYYPDLELVEIINFFPGQKFEIGTVNRRLESQGAEIGIDRLCILNQCREAHVRVLLVPIFQDPEIKRLDHHALERQVLVDQVVNEIRKYLW